MAVNLEPHKQATYSESVAIINGERARELEPGTKFKGKREESRSESR